EDIHGVSPNLGILQSHGSFPEQPQRTLLTWAGQTRDSHKLCADLLFCLCIPAVRRCLPFRCGGPNSGSRDVKDPTSEPPANLESRDHGAMPPNQNMPWQRSVSKPVELKRPRSPLRARLVRRTRRELHIFRLASKTVSCA